MPKYTAWTWSPAHGRHYSYLMSDDGRAILDTVWSGPTGAGAQAPPAAPLVESSTSQTTSNRPVASARRVSKGQSANLPPSPTQELYDNDEQNEDQDEHEGDGGEVDNDDSEDNAGAATNKGKERQRIDSAMIQNMQSLNISTSTATNPYSSPLPTHQGYGQPQYPYAQNYNQSSAVPSRATSSNAPAGPHSYSTLNVQAQRFRPPFDNLPEDVRVNMHNLDRRYIRTEDDISNFEKLDSRYKRVALKHHPFFFVPGRVFMVLWTEPAGEVNPGKTRNSTHFSTTWCNGTAYSEIRRFVVVRNKGTFSQCIPVQTYRGRGATKPGLVMQDHGVIHTTLQAPNLLAGENLSKYSIRVHPTGTETLGPESRVNYGKAYAVEHNVKVLDIGMVVEGHRYLIEAYFKAAMGG